MATAIVYFRDRTLAIFEDQSAVLPVPDFAEGLQLTVGQLFRWLEI
ncbi:hypothetical protein [Pseudanabaena sp. ABRG5-3]|nr:hypothetical protein [Pseudanabaena sp. ABRG5-3]